jgi:hypothetical protein
MKKLSRMWEALRGVVGSVHGHETPESTQFVYGQSFDPVTETVSNRIPIRFWYR